MNILNLVSCARSTACTKPRAHTQPITCNTLPQKEDNDALYDLMTLSLKYPSFCNTFPFLAIPATSHYPIATDRYSPQYVVLTLFLHFMSNTFFPALLPLFLSPSPFHFNLVSPSYSQSNSVNDPIPKPFDVI